MSRTVDNALMTTQRHRPAEVEAQLPIFGQALKHAYETANVSKRQLAAASSLDRAAITRIEQGKRAPKFDKLLLLARGAKTPPATLLAGIGQQEIDSQLRAALRARHKRESPSRAGEPVKRFADNLRWVRQQVEPGLTQEGLALEADIDRSTPNGYETGRMAPPTLRTILKLAAGLRVSPGLLMEGVELPPR
jgi:transcriptional regulator with XRE-family HTH domain